MNETNQKSSNLNGALNYLLGFIVTTIFLYLWFPYFKSTYRPRAQGLSTFLNYPKKFDIFASYLIIFIPALFCLIKPIRKSVFIVLPEKIKIFLNKLVLKLPKLEIYLKNHGTLSFLIITIISLTRFANIPKPTDRYHFGEYVLPYFTFENFKALPYIDIIPAHGLLNFLPGFLFSSQVHTVFAGYTFITFLINLSLGILLFRKLENKILALVLFFLFPSIRFMYLATFVMLVVWRDIFRHDKWKDCSLAALMLIFFAPLEVSVGIGMSILYSFLFSYYAFTSLIKRAKSSNLIILFLPYLLLVLLLAHPLARLVVNELISTILKLASLNLDAFGIPLTKSFSDHLPLLLFKFSFLPACSYLLIKCFKPTVDISSKVLHVSVLIFVILLLSYSMGRIDAGSISRPGFLSGLLLSYLALCYFNSSSFFSQSLLAMIFLYCVIKLPFSLKFIGNFSKLYSQSKTIETTYVEVAFLKKIKNLYSLRDSEYLDLTNNNLNYFFIGLMPPNSYLSLYNTVDVAAWKKLGDNLKELKVILLKDPHTKFHDGVKLQHRSMKFAQTIADNCHFKLIKDAGYNYLLRTNDCSTDAEIKNYIQGL